MTSKAELFGAALGKAFRKTAEATFGGAGKGYLRLSYANSVDQIEEGVKRMQGVLEKTAARA